MSLLWKPRSLAMIDFSRATADDRILMSVRRGSLILQLCQHAERGRESTWCLDDMSQHPKLQEVHKGFGHGDGYYFPHTTLIGLPAEGESPQVEIFLDKRLQRRYALHTEILGFDFTTVGTLIRNIDMLSVPA